MSPNSYCGSTRREFLEGTVILAAGASGILGWPLKVLAARPDLLHQDQGRKQVADLFGQVGVGLRVLRQGRTLAAAVALEEILRQPFDGVAVGLRIRHIIVAPSSSARD